MRKGKHSCTITRVFFYPQKEKKVKKRQILEKRKKFIMELLGDPLYKPMRLRGACYAFEPEETGTQGFI